MRTLRADVQREEAGLEALVLNDRSGGSTNADSVSRLEQLRSQILMLYDRGSRSAWQQPPLRLVVRKGALVAPVVTEFGSVVLVATAAGKVSAHDVSDLTRKRMTAMVNGGGDGPVRGWSASTQAPDALDSSLAAMQSMLGTSLGAGLQLALDQAGIARGAAIVILPDGADALLPLSLATNAQSGRMLLEDYTISFVPSIAALGASANRVRRARRRSLALLMPPEGANLDYAPIEGRLVEAMFQSAPHDAWNGATKDSLLQGLGPRTYWHFSTHGTFDWNDPRQSGVLIGPDHAILTLADLLGARQRIGAPRLVVLSACDTGLSDINRNPDEFTGLPAGFLLAGAAGVVASLWPVNDLSTTLLMSRFYELHLVSGRSPAEALKAAQLWLRDATVVNLQAYVEAKQASGAISADQAGLIQDDLTLVQARMGPLGRPFAAPRFWGAFVLYGQ